MKEQNIEKCVACGRTISRDMILNEQDEAFPKGLFEEIMRSNKEVKTPLNGFFRNDNGLEYVVIGLKSRCACIIQ